jgi:hypothetical protein
MNNQYVPSNKLAQSASALGAALLGFGLGAKWGAGIHSSIVIAIIIIGGIIHVSGMYVVQMKNSVQSNKLAKIIWFSAWICLLSLVGIILYVLL